MVKKFQNVKLSVVALYALIVFLVFGAIYSGAKLSIEMQSLEAEQASIIQHETSNLDIQTTIIYSKANRLVSDILFLMDTYDISLENHAEFSEMESQWLSFSNRIQIFDQIRFIDVNGNECTRINYTDEGAYIVDESELQNQSERYYFINTISLNKHEIYVSQLDLNIDNGQIEQPIKPTIRLSTPCYAENGSMAGIIVLNYLADDALSELSAIAQSNMGSAFLINSDGYWIINSASPETEWAFMYEGMGNVTFAAEYPDAWEVLQQGNKGYVVTENGVFVYSDVSLSDAYSIGNSDCSVILSGGDFYLVSYLETDSEAGSLFYHTWSSVYAGILKDNALVYLLLLALSVALGVFIGINRSEKEEILYFSEYDGLTGVLNRRAGLRRLVRLSKEAKAAGKAVSICFLDINGLKNVNDTLGHDTGDELIVSVANGIKAVVRGNDIVARLGGDEFLIAFWDIGEADASNVWNRIHAEFAKINDTEKRAYVVSASYGIETLAPDSKQTVEEAIGLADEKMYANKREIKKSLRIIREPIETETPD